MIYTYDLTIQRKLWLEERIEKARLVNQKRRVRRLEAIKRPHLTLCHSSLGVGSFLNHALFLRVADAIQNEHSDELAALVKDFSTFYFPRVKTPGCVRAASYGRGNKEGSPNFPLTQKLLPKKTSF